MRPRYIGWIGTGPTVRLHGEVYIKSHVEDAILATCKRRSWWRLCRCGWIVGLERLHIRETKQSESFVGSILDREDVLKRVGGFVDPLRDGGDGQRFFEVEVAGGPTIEHLGQPSRTLSALLFRSL